MAFQKVCGQVIDTVYNPCIGMQKITMLSMTLAKLLKINAPHIKTANYERCY